MDEPHPLRQRLAADDPVLLDGGFSTTLEAGGYDLGGALWSARALLDAPDAVRAVHAAFLAAGAEVITTASYQLAAHSLAAAGYDPDLAPWLFARSVALARDAVTAHLEAGGHPALVAGSVGPYGAVLADGSEYRGGYDLDVDALAVFHAPRIAALVAAGADVLACETVPCADEVLALARVLDGCGTPAWVTVTLGPSGRTTAEGQPLRAALRPLTAVAEVVAIGVNCCPPALVEPASAELADLGLPLVAQPNVGDRWDATARTWIRLAEGPLPDPRRWVAAGARLVGGCCGTGPADLTRLARQVRLPGTAG